MHNLLKLLANINTFIYIYQYFPLFVKYNSNPTLKIHLTVLSSIWRSSHYVPKTLYFIFLHDDIIKWKHFPCYWPFVQGIHLSPVNSPHKGQWRGNLMFSLICACINNWLNNEEAGDLRWHCAHYEVTVMHDWNGKQQCLAINCHCSSHSAMLQHPQVKLESWLHCFIKSRQIKENVTSCFINHENWN